ncbi:glycoside transferase family 2, partial [Oenococcus oeni]
SNSVSAIIVTYNRLHELRKSLTALTNIPSNLLTSIIVINNASNDGTKDYLYGFSQNKRIKIIDLSENTGGAGGFNAGIRYFYEKSRTEFAWLMDDDTIVTENSLRELLEATKLIKASFYSSDVRWVDGSPALMNVVRKTGDFGNGLKKIEKATFVSLMIPRKFITRVGFPQKEYFIWGDDMEYTERLSRFSPGCFVTSSKVIHEINSNIASGDIFHENNPDRISRYYYEYRNRLVTGKRRKNFFIIIRPFIHTFIDFSKVIFGKTKYKSEKIKLIVKGTKDGIFFNPKIEYPSKKEE